MALADTSSCACGSLLRPVRCCGLDEATLAPRGATRHLLPLVDQAIDLHAQGQVAAAEAICLDVLELAPDQGGALAVLYRIRKAAGQQQAAATLLARIVRFDPNNDWATHELALLLLSKGDSQGAEIHARAGIRIAPSDPQSHNVMGMVMTQANRPQAGEYHYRRALALLGLRPPVLLANLAWSLKTQGRIAEARALYEESIALDPTLLPALLNWASMEEADRNFDRAGELLDRAEQLVPGNPRTLLQRATLFGRQRHYDAALAILDKLHSETGGLGSGELLEKGRLLDKIGRYDEAFQAFDQGKRLHIAQSGQQYMASRASEFTARLKNYYTEPRLRITPRAAPQQAGPHPIFIVGFPRCGTTMAEQTLSAHPLIAAGDELPFIGDIAELMPRMLGSPLAYPEALADLWMGDQREGLDNARDLYLQRVRQLGFVAPGKTLFTDKMPLNEMHLGLIGLLFPDAPIIHMLRHPLDVVLSMFSNHLTHGYFSAHALESAARHYVLIADLVAHYRGQMTLKLLMVRYEDLIADQEPHVRRMLDFVGVDFDARCLSFHENRRYARTASYAQVTEKLYSSSRFRYRHYLKHLAPVIPILEPVITQLGYTIDA